MRSRELIPSHDSGERDSANQLALDVLEQEKHQIMQVTFYPQLKKSSTLECVTVNSDNKNIKMSSFDTSVPECPTFDP